MRIVRNRIVSGLSLDEPLQSASEVSNEECEDDLVMQKCIGSSSEEENITLQSSVAGPSGSSRTTCSKRNPVVYEWKEISSDSKERGTIACNVWFMVRFCAQKCECINAKIKCMHISLLYHWSLV